MALRISAITSSYQAPEISEISQYDITTWFKPVSYLSQKFKASNLYRYQPLLNNL
jgi:hypothetical protein